MSVNTYEKMFTKGPESALPSTYEEGTVRFTTDTGRFFVDGTNSRTEVTDFIRGLTEEQIRAQLAPLANKVYISSDTNKMMIYNSSSDVWSDVAEHASSATYATNASTAEYATNASTAEYATNSGTSTYASTAGTATNVTNAVRSIATGSTDGSVNVNVNGTTSDVAVKGLKALAYKDSLSNSDVGLGNVANIDQSKAVTNITREGTTFTATALDGSTFSFTQQDNNTTYAAGAGIALNSGTFSNSGVRSVAQGTTNGTINVNTNGTTADVAVKGLGNAAYKNVSDTYSSTGTDPVSGKAVAEAIAALPEPMLFKGSLGTGGTITELPAATAANEGFTYKVITAGTYQSIAAKVGDTFISDGTEWTLIPSGDEPSGTVTSVGITAGDGIGVSGGPITTSGSITVSNKGVRAIAEGTTAGTINVNTNGTTADIAVKDAGKGIKNITRSGMTFTATAIDGSTFSFDQQDNNTTYAAGAGIALNSGTFSNSGVRSAATGATNGTINVNTNGTTADVAVKGLAALAYKDSLGKSDVGLSNVANLDQSKAITSITRSGTTFTCTAVDGSTSSFTQQDNNTTYAAGAGIALNSGTFSNSGVRSVAQGTTNGTINVNTNGTTADVAVKGLGDRAFDSTTYVPTAGGSMTGTLIMNSNTGNYGEGIRINKGANNYSSLLIGAANGSTSGTEDGAFWIGTNPVSYPRRLFVGHNASTGQTFFYASGSSDSSPSLQLGGELKIGGNNGPTIKYNETTQSIDFIFA